MTDVTELKNTKGKILGVDFGDVRTGLAVSDPTRFLASGLYYVSPGGIEKTADKVADATFDVAEKADTLKSKVHAAALEAKK